MAKGISSVLHDGKTDSFALFTSLEQPDSSFVYLTGVRKITGCLVVKRNKQALFVSPLEYAVAKAKSKVRDIRVMDKDFSKKLKNLCGSSVGLNYDYLSANRLKKIQKLLKVKTRDVSQSLARMRMVKRKDEIQKITSACMTTKKILEKACCDARSMRTESEMKQLIEGLMGEHGVEPSFDVIVASGKNSATPHHVSGNFPLKGMTVIDLGVRMDEYCSDVTRTICFGKPQRKEMEAYRLVRQVQDNCVSMVRGGEDFSTINTYAKKKIGKALLHSVGHGLGIDVHELPFATKESGPTRLQENMVITIEPGAYYPGRFGIRIEDDVAVGKDGRTVLSKTGKELLVV